jgi:acetyl esterase/lipase
VTPRPALLYLRARFDHGPRTVRSELPVRVVRDLPLGGGRRQVDRFHLVVPDGPGPHPLVVWLHGGGWFFGAKDDVVPYVEHLAAGGHAVAAVGYPLSPESPYPAALHHLDAALPRVLDLAAEHGVDPGGLVLAGTSVGANLAAQLAAAATSADYAAELGLGPRLDGRRIRGLVLHGGIYDLAALRHCTGFFGEVMSRAAWAYTGDRRWATSARSRQSSPLFHVTADFPPTFLTGGTVDPLSTHQLAPMADRLSALGIDVEVLELPAELPASGHDFQYDLAHPAAVLALRRTLAFLDRVAPDRP